MRVIKFLAFVVLLTSQCLAADPVLKYYSSKRNIFGGQDYYYKGQFLFRSTPNVLGGENLSKGSSLEYQSRPNIHGGTTLIVPPTKRDSFSSKPTPKPAPYYNLDRYKSNEVSLHLMKDISSHYQKVDLIVKEQNGVRQEFLAIHINQARNNL